MDPFFVSKWYVSTISWCELLGYRTDVFPGDKAPTSAVDFWDVKKFPGRRAMRDNPIYNIPLALLADGVAKDQIYPLTEEKIQRAFKKLDEIKPHVNVWWTQGAQPPQLLTDKEVVMATGWNGRISGSFEGGCPGGSCLGRRADGIGCLVYSQRQQEQGTGHALYRMGLLSRDQLALIAIYRLRAGEY